jgi:predicted HTH transcriptional regulator
MHPRDNILPAKESKQVEFKTSFNDEAIVSLVAFANTQGGAVYIGVTDSGEVKGIQLGKETLADWINEVKIYLFKHRITLFDSELNLRTFASKINNRILNQYLCLK